LKTVRNKTARPMKVALPGGKTLHLGPQKTGQIADAALERPAVQKLVKAGDLEILGEGSGGGSGGGDENTRPNAQGHARSAVGHRSGNR